MAERDPGPDDAAQLHAAFATRVFERLRRPLLRYLTDLLGRREDAEDAVQDTYLRLLGAHRLERSDARVRAFVFKVATNLAYDRFRQRRVRLVESDAALAQLEGDPAPDGTVGVEQALEQVKRAVLELKPRCRQVFLMRAVEELGYEDIAAQLGVSKRTVEREMQHALEVCQRRLATRTRR